MIERFNFYDIYGYLVPGLAIVGLGWLPFGLVEHRWPQNELLSAVVVLAFGYVLGHLLQNVATNAVPSQFKDSARTLRSPSDMVLDGSDKAFSIEIKTKLYQKTKDTFGIDLTNGADGDKALSTNRNRAFLMARVILIQKDLVSYAEQFQGLYAMMRGLFVAFVLGGLYLFSWSLATFKYHCSWWLAMILLGASALCMLVTGLVRALRPLDDPSRYKVDRITLTAAAFAVCSGGYLTGWQRIPAHGTGEIFGICALMCMLGAQRFHIAYRSFAFEFARAVWRDFAASEKET